MLRPSSLLPFVAASSPVVGLLAAVAMLGACAVNHAPKPSATTATTAVSVPSNGNSSPTSDAANAQLDDTRLTTALQAALAEDPVTRAPSTVVSVSEGAVTLHGTTPSLAWKRRSDHLVESFKAVRSLDDARVVTTGSRPDTDLGNALNLWIASDPATRNAHVKATVTSGVATIRGTVDSQSQRHLLETQAAHVEGIRGVTTDLSSASRTRPNDETTTEANDRVRDDARLGGASVTVLVHGRRATLVGLVGSLAQRDAAIDDARVSGVDDVDAHALRIDWRANDAAGRTRPVITTNDADLGDAVRRRLADDMRIGFPLPTVQVNQAVVTLTGDVLDFRAQRAATSDASGVRGVQRIDDQITLAPALQESDATIQDQVERSVLNDLETPDAPHLQISTTRAKVTLRGAVFSQHEKRIVEDDVEAIPGVIAVENDLRVEGYGAETDAATLASLSSRVIERLYWDARLQAGTVTAVTGKDGTVTLTGTVTSADQSRAAADDALQAGAARVDNRIVVTPSTSF